MRKFSVSILIIAVITVAFYFLALLPATIYLA